jgi:transcriptional regulator with XRE-family HTH domain
VRAIREARGLSLEHLAQDAHLTPRDLAMAEAGRLRLSSGQLHDLICALHIPMSLMLQNSADLSQLRRL